MAYNETKNKMENNILHDEGTILLNAEAVDHLRQSGRWSFFLAIVGFIMVGFMIIAAFAITTMMSAMPESPVLGNMKGFIGWMYGLLALFYFFPIYFLFKYASDVKQAIVANNSEMMAKALGYLKSHHKFLGISIIVLLSLYIIGIIGFIVFFATMR